MLNRFTIGTRMAGIMVVTVLGMALIAAYGLLSLKGNRIEDRQIELRHLVQSALSIVEHLHQEARAGRMSEPDAQAAALAAVGNLQFGEGDYVFVYQFDGIARAVGRQKTGIGENRLGLVDGDGVPFIRRLIEAAQKDGGFVTYRFPRAGGTVPLPKLSYAVGFAPWQWMVGTGVYIDDIDAAFREDLLEVGSISLVLILLIGAGLVLISRGITRPLGQITRAMGALAGGDTSVEVTHTGDRDEIGQLARALATFKTNALEMERLRAEQEAAKKRAEEERRAMMLTTADRFEASVKGVVDTVSSAATDMRSNAQSMSALSEQTSTQATAAAAAAEEASSNVQTVAAAAEELNASIGEINRQIAESATVARTCAEQAETTGGVVRDLDAAAETIGNVVSLIEGIAGQVNLLALNATIEAARAGDAGKGFAVVAGEVKNLANQTATATQEIAAQVAAVQSRTKTAVEAIAGITSTIRRVNEIASAIASAVEEQGAATQEIARNVQEASNGTREVTRNITGVTQSAADTGSAANHVLAAAGQLSQQSQTLRQVVDSFITQVRAG